MKVPQSFKRGAAHLFGAAIRTRAAGYDAGLFPVRRVPGLGVISVGNLRVGGSGKTPLAMFIAKQLQDSGIQTALLLRGYKGALERSGGQVSLGSGPMVDWTAAGDEAYMAALRLNGVQVWVGHNRVATARSALAAGARIAVLDDGFQHRRLYRDLDILLACPEDMHPETMLLPAGPLRDTYRSAGKADLSCGFANDWQNSGSHPRLLLDVVPTHLVSRVGDGDPVATPLEQHRGTPVYLVSGIARPSRFEKTVTDAGLNVVGRSVFNDHHRFTGKDEVTIRSKAEECRAEIILTTEKDLARMSGFISPLPLFALRIELKLLSGADVLKDALISLGIR
ncbi:MAG: tetraacyldisaccharide 4'-kinase [Proteobacteria bacterium]|nr:tetraacyldisaccharide 4'-kinase [Pseudomonadota bacterium]